MTNTEKGDFTFYNELARKYPESKVVYGGISGKIRLEFFKTVLESLNGYLLDVGCNNYVYRQFWRGDYVGIDIARKVLLCEGYEGVWSDALMLPFKNESFDYVLMTEVLEHLWKRVEALKEVYRVLKKDGEVLGSVPSNPKAKIWTVAYMPELIKWGVKPYFYVHGHLPTWYLKHLAAISGFKMMEAKPIISSEPHTFFRFKKE